MLYYERAKNLLLNGSRGSANPNPTQNRVDRAQYVTFTEGAQLGVFDPTLFHPPKREMSYNDDVALPLYESSMRSYSGNQRKGIRDEHPDASNVHEHVLGALQSPFSWRNRLRFRPAQAWRWIFWRCLAQWPFPLSGRRRLATWNGWRENRRV